MPVPLATWRIRSFALAASAFTLLASCLPGLAAAPMRADELVMFREVGCPFCAQWDHDVGKIYGKTDEAKLLPIRDVDLLGKRPTDLIAIKDVKYTPTFVVMHCGREFSRITGYLGPDQFWGLLDHAVSDLKAAPACSS